MTIASKETQLIVDLQAAMGRLNEALASLVRRVAKEVDYPVWCWGQGSGLKARRQVCYGLRDITYGDGQDANEVTRYPALVGASQDTLAAITRVNVHKMQVFHALKACDGISIAVLDTDLGQSRKRPLLRYALASIGQSRLHRKQCTRKIDSLPDTPSRVSFVWAWVPQTKKLSQSAAEAMLLGRGCNQPDHASYAEWESLLALTPDQKLIQIKPHYLMPRVNVVVPGDPKRARSQRRAVMPLFYAANKGDSLPKKFVPLEATPPGRPVHKRKDRRRTEALLLPSIHAALAHP